MNKCGAISAVVIAGSAGGTATRLSAPAGTERVAASGSSAHMPLIIGRGTRAPSTVVDPFASAIVDQSSRGEREDVQPVSIAMAAPPGDGAPRGTR